MGTDRMSHALIIFRAVEMLLEVRPSVRGFSSDVRLADVHLRVAMNGGSELFLNIAYAVRYQRCIPQARRMRARYKRAGLANHSHQSSFGQLFGDSWKNSRKRWFGDIVTGRGYPGSTRGSDAFKLYEK